MHCICNSRNREAEIGGTLDLTALAKSVVCEFSERYCVKEISWEVIKEGRMCVSSLQLHAHARTLDLELHAYICISTFTWCTHGYISTSLPSSTYTCMSISISCTHASMCIVTYMYIYYSTNIHTYNK